MKNEVESKYPRVLILGNLFNKKSGGGITMSNLFEEWPKNKLAAASLDNIMAEADQSVCANYYQLTYNGKLHPFPFSIVLPVIKSGPLLIYGGKTVVRKDNIYHPRKHKKAYNIVKNVLTFTGLYNFFYRLNPDKQFLKWIKGFSPDIIYTQLGSLEATQFVSDVVRITNIPLAIHIMDDWPNKTVGFGPFSGIIKRKTHKHLSNLISIAEVLMSIGDLMSEEYKRRYKREFIPFHNPIHLDNWLEHTKRNWEAKGNFTILYAGRIGIGMRSSVIDLARVINRMSASYKNIYFDIQTPDLNELEGKIDFANNVRYVKPVDYSLLPQRFAGVDILLLPIDFDRESRNFLRLSYQTKISEYMVSGTPVLVYAPPDTSTAIYANREGWAYSVNERNDNLLKESIIELYSNRDLRQRLGKRAREIAVGKEDSEIVREQFRNCLVSRIKG